MAHQKRSRSSPIQEPATTAVLNSTRLVVIVSCVAAIGAMIHGMRGMQLSAAIAPESTLLLASSIAPSSNPPEATGQPVIAPSSNPLLSTSAPTPAVPQIGIVAGHWGNDTGAICPDGLTEVEINLDIAQRVVRILQSLGYQATVLAEFDPRMTHYQADALVSIHADSCEPFPDATPPASGFKVASVEDSLVPEAEERLVACLAQCYAARTGMYFHANSITYDMTRYHTFYEIDGRTPAAIIETGFMRNDRTLLTQRADLVAQGIAEGIICFIEGERP